MNSSPKKILLTCFDFPPNHGIGGRRWAKLAKALAKRGYEVHVIKAEAKEGMNNSPWKKDVQYPLIKVHELPRTYPLILSNPITSFTGKVKYKYYSTLFLQKYKGTIYDNSLGWEEIYPKLASEIIQEEKIENFIITGAPFNLFYYSSLLKKKYPKLNIIIDYRDPWINAPNYGMRDLEYKRKQFEQEKQQFVLENVNHVLYPSDSFKDEILDTVLKPENIKANFETLTHFYDPDDYEAAIPQKIKSRRINIIYGGSIYMEIGEYLLKLKSFLDQLKKEKEDLYYRIDINFFTDHLDKLEILNSHSEVITMEKPIGAEYHNRVRKADFVFILLAEHNKNFRTTKFMETMPFEKPFIYFGPDGDAKQFIKAEKLGYLMDSYEDFVKMLNDCAHKTIEYNEDFDHTNYSLSAKAEQVIKLLKF